MTAKFSRKKFAEFVYRIEKLQEEKAALDYAIKLVKAQATSEGLKVKHMMTCIV